MVDQARRIVAAVDVPVIADADTGYGNALNVIRTVQAYERAGVAAMHIEDQVAPRGAATSKARKSSPRPRWSGRFRPPSTPGAHPIRDHRPHRCTGGGGAPSGTESRGGYREAGADMLFVEAPRSIAEMDTMPRRPRRAAAVQLGRGRQDAAGAVARLRELGYRVVIFPLSTLLVAARAVRTSSA